MSASERDLGVGAEQHRETRRGTRAGATSTDCQLGVARRRAAQPCVCPAPIVLAARGGRPATPCVDASTRPPGAVTRRSSRTACAGSSQCSSTCVQRTRSKLASSTGAPRPTREFGDGVLDDVDPDVLARTLGEKGVVRLRAAADVEDAVALAGLERCSSSQAASGARTAQVGERQWRPPPLLAGPVVTAHEGEPTHAGRPERSARVGA